MIDAFMKLGANDPQHAPRQQDPVQEGEGLNISIKADPNRKHKMSEDSIVPNMMGDKAQQINQAFANMIDIAKRELGQRLKRMYKFPASWDEAKVHERAYRNGFKTPQTLKEGTSSEQDTLMCPCCENFVNTIQIPLTYHSYPGERKGLSQEEKQNRYNINETKKSGYDKSSKVRMLSKDVFQIQAGDALFFCFVKLVITILVIQFIFLDAYNLYTNSLGNYCSLPAQKQSSTICTTVWIDQWATPNKSTPQGQPYFITLDYMNLVLTIISILFFIYGRIKLYILYNNLETWDVTEDDYSVLIEDIPIIPFLRNDERVKDVNKDYHDFIKKIVQKKIRAWLNSFYAYDQNEGDYRNHIDREFFMHVYKDKRQKQAEAELYDNIVTSVNLCYDLTQLENIEESRQKLMNDFIETDGKEPDHEYQLFDDELDTGPGKTKFNQGDGYVSFVPNQIDILNRHYIVICERISEGIKNSGSEDKNTEGLAVDKLKMSRFVGKAFVSLKYQHYKEYLLYRYERDHKFLRTNGNSVSLRISKATKPNDINWYNMRVSDQYRQTQLRTSYLLVAIALVISGAILFGLNDLQTQFKTAPGKKISVIKQLYLLSLPIWTYLVNYTLNWGLYQLNAYEKHKNKTDENSELIVKNVASKFFNTAVIYALVYAFGPKVNFLNTNGLVYVIISLVLVNAGLSLATEFFQPYYLYLNWSNKQILETAEKEGKVNLFQIQLNKMVEKPAYTYDNTYSYYLQMVYVVCFYGYLVPLIIPITIIAFALQYWVDKYNLLKKFSSPVDLGYRLTKKMWTALQISLLFRVVGHQVWSLYLHHNPTMRSHILNYICIFLSLAYLFVVIIFSAKTEEVIEGWASSDNIFDQPYQKFKENFSKTYQNSNPATAFVEKKADTDTDMFARITQYSLMAARRQFKKDQFVPENNSRLKQIWQNTRDETVLLVEEESLVEADKFSTILCF